MIAWILQQLMFVRKVLPGGGDSARQLATGVALGLLLGLVPKGNLLAVAVSIVILATTVNVAMATITAVAVSFAGAALDPIAHEIGLVLLTHETLQPYWLQLYELPLAPWTDLNNTVVLGSFVLGIVLFYPTYRFTLPIFQRYWVKESEEEQTDTVDTAKSNEADLQDAAPTSAAEPEPISEPPAELAPPRQVTPQAQPLSRSEDASRKDVDADEAETLSFQPSDLRRGFPPRSRTPRKVA